jgi:hypothetical protein
MNYAALREELLHSPRAAAYAPYVVTNDMPKQNAYEKDQALADMLNAPAGTRLVDRHIDAVGLMAELGTATGAAILGKLEAAQASVPALKWAMIALQSDRGIDVGHPETQTMLDELAQANMLTQAEADGVKSLAIATSSLAYELLGKPVTAADVSIALRFNAEFTGE